MPVSCDHVTSLNYDEKGRMPYLLISSEQYYA